VAVVIGVAGEGDVEVVFEGLEPLHGIFRRRVHADLPVPVQRHETKCCVYGVADHTQVELVKVRDRSPVVHTGAAERVHSHADLRVADHVHVDHVT